MVISMDPIKYFALRRGVQGFSFSGVEMPVELALEADQLLPLLVAGAALTYEQSGLFTPETLFPWTLNVDENSDTALFDGTYVAPQATVLPDAVGYLFLDYEIESLVTQSRLEQGVERGIVTLDSLAEKLEVFEHEPNWAHRSPFNPSI